MSGKVNVNGVELGWRAREVLGAVMESGGSCDTRAVKHRTGIENSGTVMYWLEKLEKAGLVEVSEGEWEKSIPAPKQIEVTDRGRELWEDDELGLEIEPGDDDLDLGERVERLEKQVERRRETYGQMRRRIVEFESELDEMRDDLEEVLEKVEVLADQVEGVDGDEEEWEF